MDTTSLIFTRYSQIDPIWKSTKLGFGSYTIGSWGCLLTDLAIACTAFGYTETPATLNEKMKKVNGFVDSLVIVDSLTNAVNCVKEVEFVSSVDVPANLEYIDECMSNGKVVICKVDYSPVAGVQDHWVVLKQKDGSNDYLILDPYPLTDVENVSITQRFNKGLNIGAKEIILETFIITEKEHDIDYFPVVDNDTGLLGKTVTLNAQMTLRSNPVIADNAFAFAIANKVRGNVLETKTDVDGRIWGKLNKTNIPTEFWVCLEDNIGGTKVKRYYIT